MWKQCHLRADRYRSKHRMRTLRAGCFYLEGNSYGHIVNGNIRYFTNDGVQVKVSAFSRVKGAGDNWSSAYLGQYPGGLGVIDNNEGSGSGNWHTVDNVDRDNYVLFEFSQPVVLRQATLGYVVNDSDFSVWIGTFADPFNNHLTLNDSVLGAFGYTEQSETASSTTRTANVNAGEVVGNAIVISASISDVTPDDYFKIAALDLCKRVCQPLSLACVSATGQVNIAYSSTLLASGGTAPYTYDIVSGSLPSGSTLNPATGTITGIPTTAGPFTFVAKVTDSLGAIATSGANGCSIIDWSSLRRGLCHQHLRLRRQQLHNGWPQRKYSHIHCERHFGEGQCLQPE